MFEKMDSLQCLTAQQGLRVKDLFANYSALHCNMTFAGALKILNGDLVQPDSHTCKQFYEKYLFS